MLRAGLADQPRAGGQVLFAKTDRSGQSVDTAT